MIQSIRKIRILLLALIGVLLITCDKMDHSYKAIIKDGEIIYVGKVDSVLVFPGKNRIAFSLLFPPDPKIDFCVICWNNRKDSLTVPVKEFQKKDSAYVTVENIPEGTYTFTLYTGDQQGHRSLETQVSGQVYGERYAEALSNKPVDIARWTDGRTQIIWQHNPPHAVGVELQYTNIGGLPQWLRLAPEADSTLIDNLKQGSRIRYRTLYLPDSLAIDTFSTNYDTITPVFETAMDKDLFQPLVLAGDALANYGWVLPQLWDGSIDEPDGFFCNGTAFPFHYTFDMGRLVQLSRYKTWQRGVVSSSGYLYAGDNASSWEVWGSASPPASDGSWQGWTKLMTCQSVKPSGLPVGSLSEEDKSFAALGEEFVFPDTLAPVRYIRIKVLQTWGQGAPQINTMEMTFWQKLK